MPPRPGPRKYDPLTAYLADLPTDEATLTFAEIEQLVGAPLPPSAWRGPHRVAGVPPRGPPRPPGAAGGGRGGAGW